MPAGNPRVARSNQRHFGWSFPNERGHKTDDSAQQALHLLRARETSMFETAIPVLQVRRSVVAEEFYCRGLGFTLLDSWPSADTQQRDPRYLTLVREGARFHVHSFQVAGVGAAAVYVFVDDVNSLYAELMSRGVAVAAPPIDQEWGTREIVVRDPDGNVITFGQRSDASKDAAT